MRLAWLAIVVGCGAPEVPGSPDAPASPDADVSADWVIAVDPTTEAGHVDPALLGHYEISGELFDYKGQPELVSRMQAIGMSDWRVGVGRWEFASRMLPALTDGTACSLAAFPPVLDAPTGSTDASLVASRDWFTDDGAAVTLADTAVDARYHLDYVRAVIDDAHAFGATPYVDLDHMPLALSASRTFDRGPTPPGVTDPCLATWVNHVSNARPADPQVFAAAAQGLVQRVVEGPGGRDAPYWEVWNEPDLGYAWDQSLEQPPGSLNAFFQMAITTLVRLDAYRHATTDARGRAIRIGLGSFAQAQIAVTVLGAFDSAAQQPPIDFLSFHSYSNDPKTIVADIQAVVSARAASAHYQGVELALSEWGPDLANPSPPDTMDQALLDATVIARGATLGLGRAHRSLFYDFIPGVPLALVHQDGSVNPAYHAYELLHALIATGGGRLAIAGAADGAFDGGDGAALVVKAADGTVRALLVNMGTVARTARVDLAGAPAAPSHVQAFADIAGPADVAPSVVVDVPARSIVLVTL